MKQAIIIDTNILFSAILNPKSKIGRILISSKKHFQFYTCTFLTIELFKHQDKLSKLTKLTALELDELIILLTRNIIFINEAIIPEKIILETESILLNVDLNDTPFVALTKHLNGKLWTGDKQLMGGLRNKKFIEILNTNELSNLLDLLEKN